MKKIRWGYKDERFVSDVLEQPCPKCGARAIVALPPSLLKQQVDGTTHVCHVVGGGCNHGFSYEVVTYVPGGSA